MEFNIENEYSSWVTLFVFVLQFKFLCYVLADCATWTGEIIRFLSTE